MHLIVVGVPVCLFGIMISCERLNPTNPYVMAAVTETHVCSGDSPLGKLPHHGHPGTCALYQLGRDLV